MMNVEIFVQSRGFSREHDYHWQKLSKQNGSNNTKLESDPALYEKEIKPLIDTRSNMFSVVFGRAEQQVYLLASGLSSNRKDVSNRPISNSVMWISRDVNNDEPILQKLAIYALRSHISAQSEQLKLDKKLDLIITNDDDFGFSAQFEQLLPSRLIIGDLVRSSVELTAQPVELYSDDGVRKLAQDLESHSLPKGKRNLIIVTGNKAKIVLDNPKVLRGLSIFDPAELRPEIPSVSSLPSQIEGVKEGFEELLDKVKKHFFPSLISVALTALVLLTPPVKNLIAPSSSSPCPPVPNVEILNLSRRYVVGEPATLLGEYDPQRIAKVRLLDETKQLLGGETQQIPLFQDTKTWKYIYSKGFQAPGRKRLILQGFDQNGKIVVEQVIPAIVVLDSSTAGKAN